MTPEENARRMREAIEKTGWKPPVAAQPQQGPSWAPLATNPALAVGLHYDLGNQGVERFAKGFMKPLPDNAVPEFAKPAQSAFAAPEGSIRRQFGDWLSRPQELSDSISPFGGGNQAMIRQTLGKVIGDPVEALSEFSGYAPASRAVDAGKAAWEEQDPVVSAGQWARSLGEGGMAAATVAGNAYGLGSLGAKAYRGGPVAALPDADMAGLKGRLAKAQTAGPSQIQTLIDDAGARAAAAESKIKPVDWSQVDMPEPAAAAAPQAPRDWAINIEGRTAPGRLRPRPEPDAYTPLDMTPEEQAAIDLSRQYQGRTSMWDQPSLSPAGPRAPAALSPEQKAAMNAEIERLALQAEDAGKAGDTGAVAKAHEDIASIMARTGRPLETSPRLQAIQDRIDAIDRELKTADGAWREEELLAEAEALMNERRELRGKAPRQGALGNSSTLGMGGGNLWDDSGMSVADSIGNFVRKLRKSPAGDQEPTFRASEPNLTFGGQRAATADTGALAKAQELDAAGAPREQIWAETGWFKGVDEKWRFEIDDSGARLSDVATSDLDRLSEYSGTLKNGFDHPDLFKAYPSLAPEKFDAYTVPFQRGARFQEAGSSPYTAAGGPNAASIRSATLHESMHGVQGAEGFATGSSYKRVMENPELRAEAFAAARENLRPVAFDDYAAKWEIPDTPYARADHASLVKQQQQALQNLDALEQKADWTGQTDVPQALKNATDTLYRRHAGEVEARNVQTRRDWTPEQRRETPPWMSQDVPDEQQIVSFGDGVNSSESGPSIAESIAEWARGIGKKSLGAKPAGYDDWAPEWRAAYDKGLPMDQASRMARAREQGFNVDEPLYHGTGKDFNEFNPGGRANGTQRLTYLSDDPSIADIYANSANYGLRGGGNPAIYPVYAKAEKPLSVSDRGPDGSSGWVSDNLSASLGVDQPPPGKYASLYDEAKKQKYDQVQIKQMSDLGGPQTQYIPLDPANIRSTAAAFDPDNIGKPTILGANGGNLGAVPDAAARTKVLQDYNAGRLSLSEAMDRGGYKSRGALYKAAEKVEERGAVRERGHPEGVGATIDKDAVAAEARAIMDEFGYIPRDYVTQIAKRLQMNRNSVGRAIFNMKLAKDPRVKGLPEWNDEANLMSTPVGKAASAGLVAGTTYLPARLAADFASDQQEEGTLPAWMVGLPRDQGPMRQSR